MSIDKAEDKTIVFLFLVFSQTCLICDRMLICRCQSELGFQFHRYPFLCLIRLSHGFMLMLLYVLVYYVLISVEALKSEITIALTDEIKSLLCKVHMSAIAYTHYFLNFISHQQANLALGRKKVKAKYETELIFTPGRVLPGIQSVYRNATYILRHSLCITSRSGVSTK